MDTATKSFSSYTNIIQSKVYMKNFYVRRNVFAPFLSSVQAQFVLNLKVYRALFPNFDKEAKVSGVK